MPNYPAISLRWLSLLIAIVAQEEPNECEVEFLQRSLELSPDGAKKLLLLEQRTETLIKASRVLENINDVLRLDGRVADTEYAPTLETDAKDAASSVESDAKKLGDEEVSNVKATVERIVPFIEDYAIHLIILGLCLTFCCCGGWCLCGCWVFEESCIGLGSVLGLSESRCAFKREKLEQQPLPPFVVPKAPANFECCM